MKGTKPILATILTLSLFTSYGQIVVNNSSTVQQLVQDVLIGNGVSATNVTFDGLISQIGDFDGSASNIGLPYGIVMSSGDVAEIVPTGFPSTNTSGAGDNDLLLTAQSVTSNPASQSINSTNDAAILEFDFIPLGDSVRFNFVFASEEYLTYVNTQFNDVFGFYISGPGFAGPYSSPPGFPNGSENLAVVPGTSEPITISTIHPGMNAAYYIDNSIGTTHSFNGFTVPITIEFQVVCGETYHFKFAVADCQDGILDTGVFFEGGSFTSDVVEVSFTTVSGDTSIIEGCTNADIVFSRPSNNTTDSLTVSFDATGTAIEGADFGTLGNSVTFLPGEDSVILSLWPNVDGITEGVEYTTITVYSISACGDTLTSSGTIWVLDEPNLEIDISDITLNCINDSALSTPTVSGGLEPYSWSWSNGDTTAVSYLDPASPGPIDYYVTATDDCGYFVMDTVTVFLDAPLIVTDAADTTLLCVHDSLLVTVNASGGITPYTYAWSSGSQTNQEWVSASLAGPVDYYITAFDDCGHSVMDTITVYLNQTLAIDSVVSFPSATCTATGIVAGFASGITGNVNYVWQGPDSSPNFVNDSLWENLNPGWYYLTVEDNICSVEDSVQVTATAVPVADMFESSGEGCDPLDVTFTNTSQYATSFEWDFGAGPVNENTQNPQTATFTTTTTVQLVAFDANMCSDTATLVITVYQCGCMDPTAVNYDPAATVDDGSCFYPEPIVYVPNVFTPNEDNVNDFFQLSLTNVSDLEFTILNRWGNKMYTASGIGAVWDGKTISGANAEDGTYFVNYTVTGIDGETQVTGHGFVQLIRD